MRGSVKSLVFFCALLCCAAPVGADSFYVAVFNFQMTSETPDWRWVEKGLADQITTDFTRSRNIMVVARDRMQAVAARMQWTPELIDYDPQQMHDIRKALKISHIVSGVYSVQDGQVTIVAQIVNVADAKELARIERSGPAGQLPTLQKEISAELLSWFSGVPAETILPHLPVWTESVKATRALYEGLDLFDQGRYEEAWLKFRQARRDDPSYLEAHYWVGRMYYFMDRYEHARRSLEHFLYIGPDHPRVGDAVKEYIHTLEEAGTPWPVLLEVYEDFTRRFPEARIYNELGVRYPISCRAWLNARRGQLLGWMGRHDEAAEAISQTVEELEEAFDEWIASGWASYLLTYNVVVHNQKTGEMVVPRGLGRLRAYSPDELITIKFQKDNLQGQCRLQEPHVHDWPVREDGRLLHKRCYTYYTLTAPKDHLFDSVTVFPLVSSASSPGSSPTHINLGAFHSAAAATEPVPLSEAVKHGITIEEVPHSGLLFLCLAVSSTKDGSDTTHTIDGIRANVELREIRDRGTLEIDCTNTHTFLVHINDRLVRSGPGLVGLLPAGEHEVRFTSPCWWYGFDEYVTNVTIREGQTERLSFTMPWKDDCPWSKWAPAVRIDNPHRNKTPRLQPSYDNPFVLVEKDRLRVIWSELGNLYSSYIHEGREFSQPRKLTMPVSSGWKEEQPRCVTDAHGRYVLVFTSDRQAEHEQRVYASWSRDFVHWSRPTMIVDRAVRRFDLIDNGHGEFIWADVVDDRITVMRSRDAYRWEILAEIPLEADGDAEPKGSDLSLLQRDDGSYELLVNASYWATNNTSSWPAAVRNLRFLSADGRNWRRDKQIGITRGGEQGHQGNIAAVHVNGRTVMGDFKQGPPALLANSRFYREAADGGWEYTPPTHDIGSKRMTMTYSNRWGYILAWKFTPSRYMALEHLGPFVKIGQDLADFEFEPVEVSKELQPHP